ncbi:hypothetical protein AB1N83_012226, partial [Pleurotus pulmonarius]
MILFPFHFVDMAHVLESRFHVSVTQSFEQDSDARTSWLPQGSNLDVSCIWRASGVYICGCYHHRYLTPSILFALTVVSRVHDLKMSANGMLEKVLAPLLVGNWINSFLFMWEILQVISYFKHYEDPIFLRLVVLTAFTVDTWSTINSFIMVYLYHVTNWGSIAYILIQHWPLPVSVLTVSITTSIVQAFLIYR